MRLAPADLVPFLRGHAVAERHGDGRLAIGRMLPVDLALVGDDRLAERAAAASGVRLEFATDVRSLELELELEQDGAVDVILGDAPVARIPCRTGPSTVPVELSGRPQDVVIWLPHAGRTLLGGLTLAGGSRVDPIARSSAPLLVHGSSITQGHGADGPTDTWPARVALELGLDLINRGFGAECHLDIAVARALRSTPADLVVLCLGINVYGQATYPRRTLRSAVAGFVRLVREGHPSTPFAVITPIASPEREEMPNAVGLTLAEVRDIVAEGVAAGLSGATARSSLIDGRDLIGAADASLLPDGLHPGSAGYALLARRLAPRLRELLPLTAERAAPRE